MKKEIDVEIIENYKDFAPPSTIKSTVDKLLTNTSSHFLSGLNYILLTNSAALSYSKKRNKTWSKGKKVKIVDCLGLYHGNKRSSSKGIELFIDNIIKAYKKQLFLPIAREVIIGEILFHELGHHIHLTQRPKYQEREITANQWSRLLLKEYLAKKYRLLYLLVKFIRKVRI